MYQPPHTRVISLSLVIIDFFPSPLCDLPVHLTLPHALLLSLTLRQGKGENREPTEPEAVFCSIYVRFSKTASYVKELPKLYNSKIVGHF